MSCGCNSNPCSCQPRPSVCCAPEQESVLYTFENANMVGIGVFDNETDFLVQFRGLVSLSASLTLNLNATDNTIELDFDDEALVADIPTATTTQRGIAETATNAEALAKAANDKILTPSNLAALGSTTTFAGLVELATEAETIAGVSTTLAVTPAGLLAAGSLYGTVTFADAVARGAAVPAFAGQFGTQLDTNIPYIATGTSAGNWAPLLINGATNYNNSITIDLNGSVFNIRGSGSFLLSNSASFDVLGIQSTFSDGLLKLGDTGLPQTINFENVEIEMGGVPVGGETLFGFNSSGDLEAIEINTFLSQANTQTGYTAFSNPATLRTCDTATVTLQQLAQIVGTLIGDLKAVLLPAN